MAVAAARELFHAGYRSPAAMGDASWQDRVDALGRGHYRRYDERTSTMLGDGAELCLRRWHGDLRRLYREADGQVPALRALLREFPGIGPTGADIYLREVQDVWTGVCPYLDDRVTAGARTLSLPTSPAALARLAGPDGTSRLAAALVRAALDRHARASANGEAGAKGEGVSDG